MFVIVYNLTKLCLSGSTSITFRRRHHFFYRSSKFVCIYLCLENTGRKRTFTSSCHCSRHRSCAGMISFLYLFVRISDSVTKSILLLHFLLFSFKLGLPGEAGEVGPKGYEVKCLSSPFNSSMNIDTCASCFFT